MGRSAVIFDLDGTITRPFLDFDAIRREMGLPHGLPILEASSVEEAKTIETTLDEFFVSSRITAPIVSQLFFIALTVGRIAGPEDLHFVRQDVTGAIGG